MRAKNEPAVEEPGRVPRPQAPMRVHAALSGHFCLRASIHAVAATASMPYCTACFSSKGICPADVPGNRSPRSDSAAHSRHSSRKPAVVPQPPRFFVPLMLFDQNTTRQIQGTTRRVRSPDVAAGARPVGAAKLQYLLGNRAFGDAVYPGRRLLMALQVRS